MMAYVYPSDSATKLILALLFAGFVLMLLWGWYDAQRKDR